MERESWKRLDPQLVFCLTISHTREWTLLPSLTSASSRADSLLALTPGTETIFSVLPPFVTHQITLSTSLPSSFPFHILLFPPNVRPFTTPAYSSFVRHPHSFLFFRSFSSPSLSLKEIKYLYAKIVAWVLHFIFREANVVTCNVCEH